MELRQALNPVMKEVSVTGFKIISRQAPVMKLAVQFTLNKMQLFKQVKTDAQAHQCIFTGIISFAFYAKDSLFNPESLMFILKKTIILQSFMYQLTR